MLTPLIWVLLAAACGCFLAAAAFRAEGRNRRLTRTSLLVLGCLFVIGGGIVWNFDHESQKKPLTRLIIQTGNSSGDASLMVRSEPLQRLPIA